MSFKIQLLFVAATFAVSSLTVASAQPLTRADVRAQLASVEHAGYNPAAADAFYPASIQSAEAKLNSQTQAQNNVQSGEATIASK